MTTIWMKKNTTIFFENGADISWIDFCKSVATLNSKILMHLLLFFKNKGIDFAIIEDSKHGIFPRSL